MQVSVTEAQATLPYLLSRVAGGEQVVLMSDGRVAAKLVPAETDELIGADARWQLLQCLYGSASNRFGPDAAHSADFLYDDNGLPA